MSQIDQEAPLVDHLTELRKRVINSIVFIGIGFIVCWFYKTRNFQLYQKTHPSLSASKPMVGWYLRPLPICFCLH